MAICLSCFHFAACKAIQAAYNIEETRSDTEQIECSFYEPRIPFIERKEAVWVKNSPNKDVVREFHKLGIARGMSENSTFWTCSNCGSWGSLSYNYCPQCGVKIVRIEQQLKECET